MKNLLLSLFFLSINIIFNSCSASTTSFAVIIIQGSDTMLRLTERLAEEYMTKNPGVSIYVEGGGTASGIRALINNQADICTASRTLQPEEAKLLADYYKSVGMFYLIAKDALTIYVNPSNSVNNLTLSDLKKIYTGKITNWKQLGGNNLDILPIIRNPNSGTHIYFKEHVLEGEDYFNSVESVATTSDMIEDVLSYTNAIGYGGIVYDTEAKAVKIDGIAPSEDNSRNDKYPITRYLHFFTTNTPRGEVKNFIDWSLSAEGQRIVKSQGFIPLFGVSY